MYVLLGLFIANGICWCGVAIYLLVKLLIIGIFKLIRLTTKKNMVS